MNITANSNVGAIAGENRGTIENCSVSGNVTSSVGMGLSANVGGIVGRNNGTITGCTVEGSVEAKDADFVGGIVGYNRSGIITDCHSSATVEGRAFVGGIAGQSDAMLGIASITACYSTGSVTGASGTTGGVAGRNFKDDYVSGILNACYWDGTVTGDTGIGYDMTDNSASEALKVSGRTTWAEAMEHMNSVLTGAGTGWQYATGSGDVPLTLQRSN